MARITLPGLSSLRNSRLRTGILSLAVFTTILIFIEPHFLRKAPAGSVPVGPLSLKYVERGHGIGGRESKFQIYILLSNYRSATANVMIGWYIPSSWQHRVPNLAPLTAQSSILDAAERALDLALQNNAFMENTKIPLLLHQTWRTLDTQKWPDIVRKSVEEWIDAAVAEEQPEHPEMAWFLWDDDGLDALIHKYEPGLYDAYKLLPYPVTKADVFRIVVVKWFGGIVSSKSILTLPHVVIILLIYTNTF